MAAENLHEIFSRHNLAFFLANARTPNYPIIYASDQYFKLTGHQASDILGRNVLYGLCQSKSVMELRDAIREERSTTVCVHSTRKDGTLYWSAFYLCPVHCHGSPTTDFFIGIQSDITSLVQQATFDEEHDISSIASTEEHRAACIANDIKKHAEELQKSFCTTDCAIDASVPSSLLSVLGPIQDNFCLSDPSLPDNPMVYCSPGFLAMTGYSCDELVGFNCRILQGPDTDQHAVQQIRDALTAAKPITITLLNYKKDKTPFLNCVHIAPIRDATGKIQYFCGVQIDVTQSSSSPGIAAGLSTLSLSPESSAEVEHQSRDTDSTHMQRKDSIDNNKDAATRKSVEYAPTTLQLLQQKGVVGTVRVASRALSSHGLRRSIDDQRQPLSPSGTTGRRYR